MPVALDDAISLVSLGFSAADFDRIRAVCPRLMSSVRNRGNLPGRTDLEKMHHLIMGELSELAVIQYLRRHGKFAESAVNKLSGQPDSGHDVKLVSSDGKPLLCSVKSSNSHSYGWSNIIQKMHFPFTRPEVRDINVRAYYALPKRREVVSGSEKDNMEMAASNLDIFVPLKQTDDKRECVLVKAITLENLENCLQYAKLLAFADRALLYGGGFERKRDEYAGIPREMSTLCIAQGRPLRELLALVGPAA